MKLIPGMVNHVFAVNLAGQLDFNKNNQKGNCRMPEALELRTKQKGHAGRCAVDDIRTRWQEGASM